MPKKFSTFVSIKICRPSKLVQLSFLYNYSQQFTSIYVYTRIYIIYIA